MFTNELHPHQNARIAMAGAKLEEAKQIVLLIHGRGATAQSMFSLGELFATNQTTLMAPQAFENTWYPYSFMADEELNQPYLDSAIELLDALVQRLIAKGFKAEQISLIGFSQGACLSLEFAARKGYAFQLIAGLSGGLIGEYLKKERYTKSLEGITFFLGCSDIDFHIPVERVHETESVIKNLGAVVEKRIYPGMGHHVNNDEVEWIQQFYKSKR